MVAQQNESDRKQSLPAKASWQIKNEANDTNAKANGIFRLEYSDDGSRLAARDRQNVVTVYETTNQEALFTIEGHENNWVESLDFSPDGKWLVTAAGSSEKVKVWNAETGGLKSEIETDAIAAYFSDDGQSLSLLGVSSVLRYRLADLKLIDSKTWRFGNEQRVAMSRDGTRVLMHHPVNRQVYQTEVINVVTQTKSALPGETSIPNFATFSPDNQWVAACHQRSPKVMLWNLRETDNARYVLQGHREQVQSLAFSHDNRWLFSSGWDRKGVVWDVLTRRELGSFSGHREHVNAIACSPIRFQFASGAAGLSDQSVIGWDFSSAIFADVLPANLPFRALWVQLGTSNGATSLTATRELVRRSAELLPELAKQVDSQTTDGLSGDFYELIARLDHQHFTVREQALEELTMQRSLLEPKLRQLLNEDIPIEARYRIVSMLKAETKSKTINIVDGRRWQRVIFALELIDGSEAIKILQRIADGHVDSEIAGAASDALTRINQ